jgi:hypothetical protein
VALVGRGFLQTVHVRRVVAGVTHVVAPAGDGVSVVEYRSHGGSARGGEGTGVVRVAMSAGLQTQVQAPGSVDGVEVGDEGSGCWESGWRVQLM